VAKMYPDQARNISLTEKSPFYCTKPSRIIRVIITKRVSMQHITLQKKKQHLFSRAAFGISYAEQEKRGNQSCQEAVNDLFSESESYTALDSVLLQQEDERMAQDKKKLTDAERKQLRAEKRASLQELNRAWVEKLGTDQARLRERMTFFWHGHFACRLEAPYALQELNNIHRRNALGSFRELLLAVSKSAAMLQFLNNQQNRKQHPNENFAREVMELFTLGRGNYTESDVKEAARAFTGWGYEQSTGAFVFREKQHDSGEKTVFGKTGNFQGEDIVNLLLEREETALYITCKIYRFFVNDRINEERVRALAAEFYKSDYRIDLLMHTIFSSDWFYDTENIGVLIKSPIDLLVSIHRLIPVTYEHKEGLLLFQRALGQAVFYPPNVSGWAGGKSWIDSSSLMFRLKLPAVILNHGLIEMVPKDDLLDGRPIQSGDNGPAMTTAKEPSKQKKKFDTRADWSALLATLPPEISQNALITRILVPEPSAALMKNMQVLTAGNHREFIMELLSTPEFQLG